MFGKIELAWTTGPTRKNGQFLCVIEKHFAKSVFATLKYKVSSFLSELIFAYRCDYFSFSLPLNINISGFAAHSFCISRYCFWAPFPAPGQKWVTWLRGGCCTSPLIHALPCFFLPEARATHPAKHSRPFSSSARWVPWTNSCRVFSLIVRRPSLTGTWT
jgi:hypothetical protein